MRLLFSPVSLGLLSLGACLPDTGDFAPGDAGSEVDAAPVDAGSDAGVPDAADDPLAGCDPLLPCVRGCDDALFSELLFEPSFETIPESMVPMSGTVYADGGELVFERASDSVSNIRSSATFSDTLLCARVRIPGDEPRDASLNVFVVGYVNLDGALQVFLEGREQAVSLYTSMDPGTDVELLGTAAHEWAEAHEMVVLVYLSGGTAYAEIFDRVTSASHAFRGSYRGAQTPMWAYFSSLEAKLLENVQLRELRIGRPSPSALAILE